jgi:OPA family glycerol-3-phosphate transporter-like MFS transporter
MAGFPWYKEKRFPLFCLLWFSYFAANLGRLSYTTVMLEILSREGFSAAAVGLVGTGFFVCYGAGQIVSGYIGDRLPPFRVVFCGLLCTGLANLTMTITQTSLQMLVIWCFNGAVQSVLWPPILRVIVEYFPNNEREKACVNISTTYPVAALFSYAACAGILLFLSWRAVFFIFSLFLFTATLLWAVNFRKMEHCRAVPEAEGGRTKGRAAGRTRALPYSVLALFCGALIVQGVLRDGLMAWIPSYMAQVFSLKTNAAILSAGVLPLINLSGIYFCQFLFRFIRDEARTSFCLFCISALAALALQYFGGFHIAAALAAFAAITACMMGINLMLVSFVPAQFSRMGIVSFLSGITNSMVYLGSSISAWCIGAAADAFGWNALLLVLSFLALASALLCLAAAPGWSAFVRTHIRTGKKNPSMS